MQRDLWKSIMFEFFKKQKLIVAGCSYVDDYAKKQNLKSFPIWPDLLAKKLGMECINLGKCAAGNKEIFSKITDAIINEKNIGLVLPMWSEFQRVSFYVDHERSWKSFHPDRDFLNAEWTDKFHKGMSGVNAIVDNPLKKKMPYRVSKELRIFGLDGIRAGTEDSIRFMYSFQNICDNKNLRYLQIQGPRPIMWKKNNKLQNELCKAIINSSYLDKMNKKTFIGWPIMKEIGGKSIDSLLDSFDQNRKKFRLSEEDTHPNEEGHKFISEYLYDKYKKIYS